VARRLVQIQRGLVPELEEVPVVVPGLGQDPARVQEQEADQVA
jgi:hypothetical protein